MPPPPLPIRDGLNPTRLHLPPDEVWPTVLGYLLHRFPTDETRLLEKIDAAEVVDGDGVPVTRETVYRGRTFVYLYRDPQVEQRVPFEIEILHRDETLLVVDKPHFLATMPRGRYIVESALVRLRRDLELPTLSPAHRLDRVTAGVLMFTVDPAVRGAYQTMFAAGTVHKEYEAIAPVGPDREWPATIRSRIVKNRGVPRAEEIPGEPNAVSEIDLIDRRGPWGRYRLRPATGKTHQLRLHMNSLGRPIRHDNFYPELLDTAHDDYTSPLQLLARSMTFTDPLTGRERCFRTRRGLDLPPD